MIPFRTLRAAKEFIEFMVVLECVNQIIADFYEADHGEAEVPVIDFSGTNRAVGAYGAAAVVGQSRFGDPTTAVLAS
jgi:hypothetical protein